MSTAKSIELQAIKTSCLCERFDVTDQVIYRGLASTIFLGSCRLKEGQVGIKAIMKANCPSDMEREQVLQEIEIHSKIPAHRNVIRLLASDETPTAFLLVTPYAPQGDLWELMKYGQTFCELQVRNCAAQMFAALHHIHTVCDLIHGDIKPHNFVLFRVEGRFTLKLIDFGLAEHPNARDSKVVWKGLRGTSGWFAPELLQKENYGKSIDVFSCGLILFRLLCGYAPFTPSSNFGDGPEIDERYWAHISKPCRQLLDQLLALQAKDRATSEDVVKHVWFTGPEPVEPTVEQLKALSRWGPPPCTTVLFWSLAGIPTEEDDERSPHSSSIGSTRKMNVDKTNGGRSSGNRCKMDVDERKGGYP